MFLTKGLDVVHVGIIQGLKRKGKKTEGKGLNAGVGDLGDDDKGFVFVRDMYFERFQSVSRIGNIFAVGPELRNDYGTTRNERANKRMKGEKNRASSSDEGDKRRHGTSYMQMKD